MNLHNVEFIKSAAHVDAVPRDGLPQIVFSGKSNVGKSSVINKLLGRKQFARVSATPGKTIHINYFLVDRKVYFVDLPGYGYAKVSKSERARWAALMDSFFRNPFYITRGVMIVDSRHKPTNDDITMANWFKESGCPLTVVANKIDKLKKSELIPNMALIRETLELPDDVKIIEFSAEKGTNRDALISEIKGSLLL
ncbi:MAG: ribosome biogenesis GTP-binding protein YihA/YsxC [Oscillospiraceae bacterium]|nr:ribosome biogenesis GTP-binding protein YihA/YsxC [Oscillospiraceae bacterium]MCL2277842.1 ribosome biogenesis GTP-binding protein YihA/YsxC [Oscillospiraceae bacterium]